jgi:predicted nucleic acid-binding protein
MGKNSTSQVLVDSNVYIQLLRMGKDPVKILGNWIGAGDLVTCGIVRLEVERGLRTDRIRKQMSEFFSVMIDVPTSQLVWQAATDLAWKLDRKGLVLPSQDHLIAASAISIGASILTDDAHFQNIPGIQLIPLEEVPN